MSAFGREEKTRKLRKPETREKNAVCLSPSVELFRSHRMSRPGEVVGRRGKSRPVRADDPSGEGELGARHTTLLRLRTFLLVGTGIPRVHGTNDSLDLVAMRNPIVHEP